MKKHQERNLPAAARMGDAVFYLGFLAGVCLSASLLYLEMKEMGKSLFDALAADSGITLSLIAAFLVPLGVGWLGRLMISGRRY